MRISELTNTILKNYLPWCPDADSIVFCYLIYFYKMFNKVKYLVTLIKNFFFQKNKGKHEDSL